MSLGLLLGGAVSATVGALSVVWALIGAPEQYLESQLGLGPLTTGVAFPPLTLGIFGMLRVTPLLLARLGRTPMFVVGALGLVTSFLWLSQVPAADTFLSGAFGPVERPVVQS